MYRVEMLAAGCGDCLWIEYGDPAAPNRVLIDGGIPGTAAVLRRRIEALPREQRRFDLLVVTHIDLDHIGGILKLLRDPPAGLAFADVWFNGFHHLALRDGMLGPLQGEALTEILERDHAASWNLAFRGGAVAREDGHGLPARALAGGMEITLLAPTRERLLELRPQWEAVVEREERKGGETEKEISGLLGEDDAFDVDALADGSFSEDDSKANGSSIAFVAAFGERRCLFAGDAFAGDLTRALGTFAAMEGAMVARLDAVKLSHHGGRKNTSRELVEAISSTRYLVSTDGSRHDHPHAESIARVAKYGAVSGLPPQVFFNSAGQRSIWGDRHRSDRNYEPVFPAAGADSMVVDL